jgi:predicted transcriptional regulator
MATTSGIEKVTFNMPTELKEQVLSLKDELHVSLSSIYNEAIKSYLKQQEVKKWKTGVSLALKDKEYLEFAKELSNDDGDIYEY